MVELSWKPGDVPVAVAFDDPYFSLTDGAAEAAHVFVDGNDLPTRFRPGFHIAELGFGTGLNAVVAAAAWDRAGTSGTLKFTSFEAFPISPADMATALSSWPDLHRYSAPLIEAWANGAREFETPHLSLSVIEGDARETLPDWQGRADAWFLDGFSPAKNPQMWEASLMQSVADHSAPDASFATYSAAGHVRGALAEAGFTVERRPGFGRKRHMSVGRL